jgi:ubiquinone biosynthesis monooxygenase Coq7
MRWFPSESTGHALRERLLIECDHALRTLRPPSDSTRVRQTGDPDLDLSSARQSRKLLRVDHAGEVAAQALYRGQALAASGDAGLATSLLEAAEEERRHLTWCAQRLSELGGRTSRFNPIWYVGAFLSGVLAGRLGRAASLGYLAETEHQVEAHLDDHLARLPEADLVSRAILEKMKAEEAGHRQWALTGGGKPLPRPVRALMHGASRALVYGSYWL